MWWVQIPGLNAPIPPGAQFGYQPGGWGKPPVDEEGNPLYGDVFGLFEQDAEDELVRETSCAHSSLTPDLTQFLLSKCLSAGEVSYCNWNKYCMRVVA